MQLAVGKEYKDGRRVSHNKRLGAGERVAEAVLALALCHNVTPVYDEKTTDETQEESLPESEQVGPRFYYLYIYIITKGLEG